MVLLGGSMLIVGLLALGGLAHAQTNVPKPNTTSQQPSGTVPSSQTEAQGQPGQEIQEEALRTANRVIHRKGSSRLQADPSNRS